MPKPLTEQQKSLHAFAQRQVCYVCDQPARVCHLTPVLSPESALFIATSFCASCVSFFEDAVLKGLVVENVLVEARRPLIAVVHMDPCGGAIEERMLLDPNTAN